MDWIHTCRKLSAGAEVRLKGCHSYRLMSPHCMKMYCPGLRSTATSLLLHCGDTPRCCSSSDLWQQLSILLVLKARRGIAESGWANKRMLTTQEEEALTCK